MKVMSLLASEIDGHSRLFMIKAAMKSRQLALAVIGLKLPWFCPGSTRPPWYIAPSHANIILRSIGYMGCVRVIDRGVDPSTSHIIQ